MAAPPPRSGDSSNAAASENDEFESDRRNRVICSKLYFNVHASKRTRNSIHQLPVDLVIHIVSRLPVLEVGRASVLGHEWRHLWMFSSVLDFDATTVIRKLKETGRHLHIERERYAERVNRVVDSHSGSTIDEFRICFDLDRSCVDNVDKWLQFAFAKSVKMLELDFVLTRSGAFYGRYSFPNICNPIEYIRFFPSGISSCESLVTLKLTRVDVTGEVLEFFISSCPFLEELHVRDTVRLKRMRATCPAMRLRHLTVLNCIYCKTLEICSSNLLSFVFSGDIVSVVLKNVSSLISISLEAVTANLLVDRLNRISGCFSQLETLMLETPNLLSSFQLYEVRPTFPNFPRLKKLVLNITRASSGLENLLYFTPLIDVAPLLCEIVVNLRWSRPEKPSSPRAIHRASTRRLQCLQLLHIVNFVGKTADLEFALYVIENAVSLNKIILDFYQPLGDIMSVEQMAVAAEGVHLLNSKLSKDVELIVS